MASTPQTEPTATTGPTEPSCTNARPPHDVTDVLAAKRALARLVDPAPVADAERALRDLDRAAAFREAGGLDRLRRVVERSDGRRARRARAALATFERFERAATGEQLAAPRRSHLSDSGTSSSIPVPEPDFESQAHVSYSRTRPSSSSRMRSSE